MTPDPRRRAGIVGLIAAAAYLPSLSGVFQFDDYNVIVNEPTIHSWRGLLTGMSSGVRPLLKASYALSWSWGLGPIGFHLFNIAVHAANAALLYLIGRRLTARWLKQPAAADLAAMLAALLFALHPAQTEAVTYITGRSVSLMALFSLGALLVFLENGRQAAIAGLFALALLVKETAVTFPFVLLLFDSTAGWPGWKKIAKRQNAVWLVLIAAIAGLVLNSRYRDLLTFGFSERSLTDNLLSQIGGLSYLLARLVTLRGFNIDPALPVVHDWSVVLVLQASCLAAFVVIALTAARKRPWLSFGIAWFFLQLAPTNSFVPRLDVANDRQLYLACWGLFLALAIELARLKSAVSVRVASAALLAAFAVASINRQCDYSSEIALWESSVREAPLNARAHNNLGNAYQEAGRLSDADGSYRTAVRLEPGYLKARINLRLLHWDEPNSALRSRPAN